VKKLRVASGWWFPILAIVVLLVGLVAASPVGAMETRGGQEVVVGPDEVIEDDGAECCYSSLPVSVTLI
jgi:hypothetical protein